MTQTTATGIAYAVMIATAATCFGIYTGSIAFGIGTFFAIWALMPYHPRH